MLFPFWNKDKINDFKKSSNIILLAHVHGPRGQINQSQIQCNDTERLSLDEFNDIYQGIVAAGYYIQSVYFNELDFITEYTTHPNRFENCLLYNLARNGFQSNKKTIIPAFCELVKLKYTTSSSLSCALARNKYFLSKLLYEHGIPTPKSWLLTEIGTWGNGVPPEGMLVICKPCFESASQGISSSNIFTFNNSEIKRFYGTSCVIQEYIDGVECEVPVLNVEGIITSLSPVGIDLYDNSILDEQSSGSNHYGFFSLEHSQSEETIALIKKYAESVFKLLQMSVYGRIDFRIDKYGKPFVFDVSTTPYTTKHSSYAFAFQKLGFSYSDIYQAIIGSALSTHSK